MQRALRQFAGMILAAAVVVFTSQAARAQVTITGYYTPGPNFTYQLFVNNASPDILAIVTVEGVGDATDLVPAPGFLMAFDSGFGTMDLLEDINPVTPQSFAPATTQGPFFFRSTFDVHNTTFSALDVNANFFTGTLSLTAAPEPGALPLMLSVGGLFLGIVLAKRRAAQR